MFCSRCLQQLEQPDFYDKWWYPDQKQVLHSLLYITQLTIRWRDNTFVFLFSSNLNLDLFFLNKINFPFLKILYFIHFWNWKKNSANNLSFVGKSYLQATIKSLMFWKGREIKAYLFT